MDPYVLDWLNLLARWLHVTAAIAWVGTSFYFIALDLHMHRPLDPRDEARGVGGEVWEIHGGGFYRIEKFKVAPLRLPETMHWYKWEAYTTWLSGFSLLVLLYYFNAESYLIDRAVAPLGVGQAVAISVGILSGGWLLYELLCRLLPRQPWLLAGLLFALISAVAYVSSQLFAPRAVYIQVGAMIGTWMVANVLVVIIPGQREMVRAKLEGREPEPAYGLAGKQRSVHNNYLTLPVLFAMLSNHFPIATNHPQGWLVLIAMMAISAWFRHFFNLRNQGQVEWGIPASAAVATLALAFLIWPRNPFVTARAGSAATTGAVTFAQIEPIVAQRCRPCHAEQPTNTAFAAPPKGVVLETPEQIQGKTAAIYQQAVASTAMPLGNLTGMTPKERELLGAWISQGAPLP